MIGRADVPGSTEWAAQLRLRGAIPYSDLLGQQGDVSFIMVNSPQQQESGLMAFCVRLVRRFLQLSWVRFGLVGVLNTITGLSIIYFLKWAFAVPDFPANLAGYAVGLIVSFYLNSRWTFASKRPVASSLPRFAAVILVAYVINYLVVALALHGNVNSYVAQAMGVLPYSLTTYFGSRFFVFNHSPATQA